MKSMHEPNRKEQQELQDQQQDQLQRCRQTAIIVAVWAAARVLGREEVQFGQSAVTDDGFYVDIDCPRPVTQDVLSSIEREMKAVVMENVPIARRGASREEALRMFGLRNERLKLELIRERPEDAEVGVCEAGDVADLCDKQPFASTGQLAAFTLLHAAGAYWRGDAGNKMLHRIYGMAFPTNEQLDESLARLEQVRMRDHRKLGKELELYCFSDESPGMPFYLPNGAIIRNELEQYLRDTQSRLGYREVRTPLMMKRQLWEQSGHWDHYKDNMYFTEVDGTPYAIKPMNCPGHMLIFRQSLRSYRELPLRMAEFGQVHRHEFSGALNGMMRVRTFCQDDAHLFVRQEQIEQEVGGAMDLIGRMYAGFGFAYEMELSTRPAGAMGSSEQWREAETALKRVLDGRGAAYRINEGDGAFYGPKIDFHIRDVLGRSWQCGTIQLDFLMPEKFGLEYVGEDGGKHRPIVIHRAVYGSLDRFVGMLTEHYGGAFPAWLAPVQAGIVPVSAELHLDYACLIQQQLQQAGIRADLDASPEKLGYRMRRARMRKIPYVLVVGDRERQSGTVALMRRGASERETVPAPAAIDLMLDTIRSKT